MSGAIMNKVWDLFGMDNAEDKDENEYEYEDYSSVKFRYPEGDKMEFETNAAKMVLKKKNLGENVQNY